jgi:hypothetical protein
MGNTMTVDATDRAVNAEVAAARDALFELASSRPSEWWTAYDLKVRARNGWSAGAMGLALRELIDEGVLEQREDDLRVRVRAQG